MFFDLDRQASADLLQAERIGLPVTLVILLVAFAAPLAATLPVLLALAGVVVSAAALFFISFFVSVSVFSENVVSMIGLGVGVDYALFVVTSYRAGLAGGLEKRRAAEAAIRKFRRDSMMQCGATCVPLSIGRAFDGLRSRVA